MNAQSKGFNKEFKPNATILFISTLLPLHSINAQAFIGSTLSVGNALNGTKEQFIEALIPFRMKYFKLSFLQAGFYKKDPHQTLSLGWGQRFFITPTVHWGYNLFCDKTICHPHYQWGVGGELGWNTLKLFVNGYWPLSDWKVSEKHKGYDERPIQKVDMGMQGYFAKFPRLGASLHYQYDLSTKNLPSSSLPGQHPSSLWMIGFDYTPLPLLTVDYRYQTGSRQAHHRFGLTINFRLQTSLTQQLDPNSVVKLRTSMGYRFDRVIRQHEINLTYKRLSHPINQIPLVTKSSTLSLSTHQSASSDSDKTASTAKSIIKRSELSLLNDTCISRRGSSDLADTMVSDLLLEDDSIQRGLYDESLESLFGNGPIFSDETQSTPGIHESSLSPITPFDYSFKSSEYHLVPNITDSKSPENNLRSDSGFYERLLSSKRCFDFK